MTDDASRISLWVAAVGGLIFVALAAFLVPWHPVPGGVLESVPPRAVFTVQQIERAEEFSRWARVWSWSSLLVSLAIACWFGFSRRGRALAERLRGPWWWRVTLAVIALSVIGRLVTLPFAVMMRRLVRDNGLSTQGWGGFASDLAKNEAIGVVVTSLALVAIVGCARRWRRAWPAVAGAVLAVLVLAGSFAYPLVVEPMFNSFTPLPDGDFRTAILHLAEQEDVQVNEVLVADASRRTTTLNAYVSGFGNTRRVVVYDNLVNDLARDEALSVIAHELAHARHDDVLTGSALGAAGAMFGVGLLGLVVGSGRRRGLRMADPAVVPLVLALLASGTLLGSPVQNTISRQIETRADVDALRTTDDSASFIELQRQLAVRSLADPTPPAWSQFWFGSHPTTLMRIALAERIVGD